MWQLIIAIVSVFAVTTVVTGFVLWDDIRDRLASWLRSMGWHKSVLMEALVRLDILARKVRCRLVVTTRQAAATQIGETRYSMDQITDPEVRAELHRRGFAERSVLHLVN